MILCTVTGSVSARPCVGDSEDDCNTMAGSAQTGDCVTVQQRHTSTASVVNMDSALYNDKVLVKTNPVGWGLLIGNVGVEYQFNRRLSAELWVYYSALNYFSRTTKFRTLTAMPTLKWWFAGSAAGTRWWADVHMGVGLFNYAKGGEWRYQDHNGCEPALGGGLGLGMRVPLGKSGRWWFEPSVGAGVYRLYYDKFVNGRNGRLVSTHRSVFCGVDRVSLALCYKFDARRHWR